MIDLQKTIETLEYTKRIIGDENEVLMKPIDESIQALRQALAKPQTRVGEMEWHWGYERGWDAAMNQKCKCVDAVNMTQERVDEMAKREQEPGLWLVQYKDRHEFVWGSKPEFRGDTVLGLEPLYTAPPHHVSDVKKREWVGLTDEDLSVCDEDGVLLARYWEAKLKEKNT